MPRLPDLEIDRNWPIPFYFQLAELLEQEITEGRLAPGERLPSEAELCSHFGLSRTTVRQALGRLEQEGLVRREKGRGSYVTDSHRRTWLLQSVEGFFEDETGRSGHAVSSQILNLAAAPLPRWALTALALPPRSEGVTLERLRSVDGRVAMYVVNYLPLDYADAVLSMADPNESLYGRLRKLNDVEVAGASRTLEAIPVGERLGSLLELPPSAPAIAVHSISWDRDGHIFDCYVAWLRTDRLTIDIEVGATLEPARASFRGHDVAVSGARTIRGDPGQQCAQGDPKATAGDPKRRPRWRIATADLGQPPTTASSNRHSRPVKTLKTAD